MPFCLELFERTSSIFVENSNQFDHSDESVTGMYNFAVPNERCLICFEKEDDASVMFWFFERKPVFNDIRGLCRDLFLLFEPFHKT